jgi:hypothetical protein
MPAPQESTATIDSSSEVFTTCPRPLRSRSSSASWIPWAAKIPASTSAIAMPARVGPVSGVPVRLMKPLMPWAIWSRPGRSR